MTELAIPFDSLASWRQWLDDNRWIVSQNYISSVVSSIRRWGMFDPFNGYARPKNITIDETNLRESVLFKGVSSRGRAVLKLISDLPRQSVIYAPESITALAGVLINRFPNFIGSEYKVSGERHEDVMNLSFSDASLDVYISCEIMEHIPSIDCGLCEAARVLKRGGKFIATFPFRLLDGDTVTKATVENGSIRFLSEPEYHGDPASPNGSLVFSIPGWDIVDLAKNCGFSQVDMVAVSSRWHGVVSDCPIFVMRAIR